MSTVHENENRKQKTKNQTQKPKNQIWEISKIENLEIWECVATLEIYGGMESFAIPFSIWDIYPHVGESLEFWESEPYPSLLPINDTLHAGSHHSYVIYIQEYNVFVEIPSKLIDQWPMTNDWMTNDQWSMTNDQWPMTNDQWPMTEWLNDWMTEWLNGWMTEWEREREHSLTVSE